jgi:hypothetical protein
LFSPHRNGYLFSKNSGEARAAICAPKLKIEIGPERWTWKIGIPNDSQRILDLATNACGQYPTSPNVVG